MPASTSTSTSSHSLGVLAGATGASLLTVLLLPEVHSTNRVLDAVPATASVARDVVFALLALAWVPMLVVVAVIVAAALAMVVGRAALHARPVQVSRVAVTPQP